MKTFRKQVRTAELAARQTADCFISGLSRDDEEKAQEEMNFTVKASCQHGELVHRRKTPEAALKKARELSKNRCYDVHIITPEGRDYASSEFGDLPRTPRAPWINRNMVPNP
jgi:hypothetical protein